jgi:hypothetical protein
MGLKEMKDYFEKQSEVNKALIVIALCGMFALFIFLFGSHIVSATEVIDNPGQNPFNNQSNSTAVQNLTEEDIQEIVEKYLGNTTDLDRALIEQLINITKDSKEEKQLLDSIFKLMSRNQQDFTKALQQQEYALNESNKQRDQAVTEKTETERKLTARIETLETTAETDRLEIAKLKGFGAFYLLLGLIFGIVGIEVANFLKDRQKSYFIIKKIRDKIPIKF